MTELSFLISLLLNEKLPLELKGIVAERIKEVETRIQAPTFSRPVVHSPSTQSPSTQRILDEMASEAPVVIAQTPQASAALAQRAQAIAQATSGKEEPGRRSPRKF